MMTIPLDPTMTAKENAQKYFERYNKLKRTFEALSTLTVETENELAHLESIMTSIDIAASDVDLDEIRRELGESGYIKSHGPKGRKDNRRKCVPYHYLSSDGFDIYVGKNNYQNEELTFKFAQGNDIWMHAKKHQDLTSLFKQMAEKCQTAPMKRLEVLLFTIPRQRLHQRLKLTTLNASL